MDDLLPNSFIEQGQFAGRLKQTLKNRDNYLIDTWEKEPCDENDPVTLEPIPERNQVKIRIKRKDKNPLLKCYDIQTLKGIVETAGHRQAQLPDLKINLTDEEIDYIKKHPVALSADFYRAQQQGRQQRDALALEQAQQYQADLDAAVGPAAIAPAVGGMMHRPAPAPAHERRIHNRNREQKRPEVKLNREHRETAARILLTNEFTRAIEALERVPDNIRASIDFKVLINKAVNIINIQDTIVLSVVAGISVPRGDQLYQEMLLLIGEFDRDYRDSDFAFRVLFEELSDLLIQSTRNIREYIFS